MLWHNVFGTGFRVESMSITNGNWLIGDTAADQLRKKRLNLSLFDRGFEMTSTMRMGLLRFCWILKSDVRD